MKAKPISVIVILFLFFLNACKKDDKENPVRETGTVSDIENNTYATVKIGNQWWMAEDLRVKKYRNGLFIQNLQSDRLEWSADTIGAYCEVFDNNHNNIGVLYNWNAVNHIAGLAPAGWHIPDDNEWKQLEQFLGMTPDQTESTGWRGSNEGDQLKVPAPNGWTTYGTVWGTNESGFSATAKGCRMFYGGWGNPGLFATGFWWSSTQNFDGTAFYRYLDYKKSAIYRSSEKKAYGFSIRCVKD